MTTLEIINLIESDKKRKRICPDHACKIEVIKAAQAMNMIFANEIIESELIELERAGKIKIGDTLNDNYIIIL
jgi:hypothetical protein